MRNISLLQCSGAPRSNENSTRLSGADFEWNDLVRYNRGSKPMTGNKQEAAMETGVGWLVCRVSSFTSFVFVDTVQRYCSTGIVWVACLRYRSIDRSFFVILREMPLAKRCLLFWPTC